MIYEIVGAMIKEWADNQYKINIYIIFVEIIGIYNNYTSSSRSPSVLKSSCILCGIKRFLFVRHSPFAFLWFLEWVPFVLLFPWCSYRPHPQ